MLLVHFFQIMNTTFDPYPTTILLPRFLHIIFNIIIVLLCSRPSSSPTSLRRAWRRAWSVRTAWSARSSWTSPTCRSGNPCCTAWASSIPPCRNAGSLAPSAGTSPTSSTSPIWRPPCSLCRTIWMTWTPRRWGAGGVLLGWKWI